MSTAVQELSIELGRRLVAQYAPRELGLYPVVAAQYRQLGALERQAGDDIKIGFGATEGALLSSAILAICAAVGEQLLAVLTERGVAALTQRLGGASAGPTFSSEHREQVREVAYKKARQLGLDAAQARLLADAIVGNLDAHAH